MAASREKIFSCLHTKVLLSLWLCRLVEGDVVDSPTKPILFLWSEQKVRPNFVSRPGRDKSHFLASYCRHYRAPLRELQKRIGRQGLYLAADTNVAGAQRKCDVLGLLELAVLSSSGASGVGASVVLFRVFCAQ